jgi:hypothetical protein
MRVSATINAHIRARSAPRPQAFPTFWRCVTEALFKNGRVITLLDAVVNVFLRSPVKPWGAGASSIPQDAHGEAIAGRIKRSGNVLVAFGVSTLSRNQSSERSPTSVACCG